MLSRRDFLHVSLAAAAAAALPRRAAGARAGLYFDWKKLPGDVHVAVGEGGNSLLMPGRGGSLLVDTKNTGFGAALRREAGTLGPPVRLAVNTHHHFDHTGGNPAFGGGDAPLLAHAKAAPRIAGNMERYQNGAGAALRQLRASDRAAAAEVLAEAQAMLEEFPGEDAFTPRRLIDPEPGGGELVTVGGHEVELLHFGAGHTDNDLVVYLPAQGVVHTGDLVFNRTWPYFDLGSGATSRGWISGLQKILEVGGGGATIVPGHGEIGTKEIVTHQITFFETLAARAAKAAKEGVPREDFVRMEVPAYDGYGGAGVKPVTLGNLYDEANAA